MHITKPEEAEKVQGAKSTFTYRGLVGNKGTYHIEIIFLYSLLTARKFRFLLKLEIFQEKAYMILETGHREAILIRELPQVRAPTKEVWGPLILELPHNSLRFLRSPPNSCRIETTM